jgi:purine-binding chemotaxis protein CheW
MRLLLTEIGGLRYGMRESDVVELLPAVATTRLPRAPPVVEGVANIRGRVVPVLDVRARFGLAAKETAPGDHLVVCNAGLRRVAFRVDRALDLVTVADDAVEDARSVVSSIGHLVGVAKLRDGLTLIHDIAAFLTQAEQDAIDVAMGET